MGSSPTAGTFSLSDFWLTAFAALSLLGAYVAAGMGIFLATDRREVEGSVRLYGEASYQAAQSGLIWAFMFTAVAFVLAWIAIDRGQRTGRRPALWRGTIVMAVVVLTAVALMFAFVEVSTWA